MYYRLAYHLLDARLHTHSHPLSTTQFTGYTGKLRIFCAYRAAGKESLLPALILSPWSGLFPFQKSHVCSFPDSPIHFRTTAEASGSTPKPSTRANCHL